MFKKFFIIFLFTLSISNLSNAKAISLSTENEFKPNSHYNVSVNIDFNEINEKIYFLQAQINYDTNIFEKITASDITLSNGWHDIVFNGNNGMFVVECDNLNNQNTQEIMKIKLKTKKNIQSGKTHITINNIKQIGENQLESQFDSHDITVKIINNNNDGKSDSLLPFLGSNNFNVYLIIPIILLLILISVLIKKFKKDDGSI